VRLTVALLQQQDLPACCFSLPRGWLPGREMR